MKLPPPLNELALDELISVLETITNGGPYDDTVRRTAQYLSAFGYAKVATIHHAPVDGVARVELRSAALTERGVAMLDELRSERRELED